MEVETHKPDGQLSKYGIGQRGVQTMHYAGRHKKKSGRLEKGFYFIALKANLPILLYGVDYEKKEITCTECFHPTGDVEKDMKHIKLYFKDFKGKKPENFSIGDAAQE